MADRRSNPTKNNVFSLNYSDKILNRVFNDCRNNKAHVISQYVSEVLGFSSHYGSDSSVTYTAYNLTGKPSNFPNYGDFPQAFAMKTYGNWWRELPSRPEDYMAQNNPSIVSHDYIDVAFESPVYPTAVDIFETQNPGTVVRIWALDDRRHHKKWGLLWEGPPQVTPQVSRQFSPPVTPVEFSTRVLRIEFNHSLLYYYTALEAVLLLGVTQLPASGREGTQIANEVIKRNLHNIPCNAHPHDLSKLLSDYMTKTACFIKDNTESRSSSVTFECLPNETILKILGLLDLESLQQMSQVSRALNHLCADQLLYARLSLRPYWHKVCDSMLMRMLPRCGRLQKLDLSWCGSHGFISTAVFEQFVTECCQNLTHIRLNCCNFVRNSTIKALTHTCPNLRELGLRNCIEINEIGFLHLTSLSQLKSLDLYRTVITGNCLVLILKANPELLHLDIGACAKITNMDEIAQTLGAHNKELRSLELWKNCHLTQAGVKAISQCSKLEELDLGWSLSPDVPVEGLASLAHGCPNLRKLFLTALRGMTDKDLKLFSTCCPHLEQVDLMGANSVTADECFRLLANLEKLRLLDLTFCHLVPYATVLNWRARYPKVSIKSSDQGVFRLPNNVVI